MKKNQKPKRSVALKHMNFNVVKLMQLMAEHNYITTNEVLMLHNHSTAFLYLNFLADEGLSLKAILLPGLAVRKMYYLSGKGYNFLKKWGYLKVRRRFTRADFSPTLFRHTLAGIQARIILQKHPKVIDYKPEQVLRAERKTNPARQCDAELTLKTPNGQKKYGIEIQFSKKSKDTWKKKYIDPLERKRDDLEKILWICPAIVYPHVRKAITGISQSDKHLFITLEKLKAEGLNANWQDRNGHNVPSSGP